MACQPPVCLAFFTDSLEPSGVGEVISLLAQTLPSHRYRQTLICCDDPALDPLVARCARTVRVKRLTVRDDGHVREFAELVTFLQQEKVQLFHNHIGATWEGDWGTLAARAAGVPVVVTTEHVPCLLERPSERGFKRRINRLPDRIIAVSESVRQTHLQAEIAVPEQVVTIQNGIDLSRFAGLEWPEAVKEIVGPAPGPLIGTVGRMTEQKGHVYLLQAVPEIVSRHPDVRFLWVGDGPERSRLEAEAERLGVRRQIHFAGRQPEAWRWLPAFAFTALPSLFEGLPLAALESMAAGRAVVGARVCGTMDAVQDGETGLLVPPRDPDALAAAIVRLLDRPAEWERMGWQAAHRAKAEFSVQRMVHEHEVLYEQLLAARTGARRERRRLKELWPAPAAPYAAGAAAPGAIAVPIPSRGGVS